MCCISYIAIYRHFNVKQLKQDMKSRCNPHCTCDQCDSPFCALQPTALIKPDWCFLIYCCACLYHSLEVVQPSWIAVPCPTTKLSLLISKSFVRIKQGVIRVALKTLLKTKVGNLYLQNFTSASTRWVYWFYIKLSPHILQRNCAHNVRINARRGSDQNHESCFSELAEFLDVCDDDCRSDNIEPIVGHFSQNALHISLITFQSLNHMLQTVL